MDTLNSNASPPAAFNLAAEMVKMMIDKNLITDPKAVPDALLKIGQALSSLQEVGGLSLSQTSASPSIVHAVDMVHRHANGESSATQSVARRPHGWTLRKAAENGDKPAVAIKDSVTPDAIICLEDGRPMKMLKRHLTTVYGMTPEQYLWRWNLPADYPLVAPNYAMQKSKYARSVGLGTHRMREEVIARRQEVAAV